MTKTMTKTMKRFTYMPRGGWECPPKAACTDYAQWKQEGYTLFRHNCAIIAERVSDNSRPRCKRCFTKGFIDKSGTWTVNHGCDGCAEMETFMHDVEAWIARKPETDGEEAR